MTNHPEIFAALAAPFGQGEVKQRSGDGGRSVSYVTSRTVANRLDEVLGPENWWFEPAPWGDHSAMGRLTIRLPDGSTVTKTDVGGAAGMSDEGDDDKSAVSDALKRAAQLFGVGRHLYGDGVPRYGVEPPPPTITIDRDPDRGRDRDALPSQARPPSTPQAPRGRPPVDEGRRRLPYSGRTLYAWLKSREDEDRAPYLRDVQAWGSDCGYPARIVDWTPEQVAQALIEANRLVDAHPGRRNLRRQAHEPAAAV